MKKLLIIVSINTLILLFTTPVYPQYCSADTTHLTGELGTNGYTLVTKNIIKCTDATYSSDGGLSGQDAIILAPNFHVKAGVNFTARVSDCRSTKPYLNIPTENAVLDNGCVDNSDWRFWTFEWNPVEGATEYQLYVKRQGESSPAIDNIVMGSTIYQYISDTPIFNSRLDNWEAKVRAKVDAEWTPWYGGQGDQPLVFSVEPVSTDCAPVITTPLPQATLDNGCNGVNELFNWHFAWTEVAGATAYQFIVKNPLFSGGDTFNQTVTTTSWAYSQYNQVNGNFTDWTVKVRARVDGLWTDYHGSTLEEEVLLFNVEPVNTDCAPQIISPSSNPKDTLDNGCILTGDGDFSWSFTILEQPISQENELRILKPDGRIYMPPNLQITTIQDEGNPETYYIYSIFNEYIPVNELENWGVQARSKINGTWTEWFGHLLTPSQTYFDVKSPIGCGNLVDNEAFSRNQVTKIIIDKPLDLKVYPNPFQQSCTIEYSLEKESEVILEVYTLTGQLLTSLVKGKKENGIHTALFERNQSLSAGILIVRLQVDGEVHYRKLVMEN